MGAWRIAVGSARRRPRAAVAALAVVTLIAVIAGAASLIRSRRVPPRGGRLDLGRNGIWLQHGWLGHDRWFQDNEKVDRIPSFRSEQALQDLGARLRAHHITDVFPHLCPTDQSGRIAAVDDAQVERFLDRIAPVRVIPWVGGTRGGSAHPDDAAWRQGFASSVGDLLRKHPRLSGVQINIEPMPSGDSDYLLTLDEVRRAMPKGKLLSIAAYPPPTALHPFPQVHWNEGYFREVASRADQMAVMMYDTALREPEAYRRLMDVWTGEVLVWSGSTKVLLGIPAYEDAGVGYHDPDVENIEHSLAGIGAHLRRQPDLPASYQGVAIYCDWEMNARKWSAFDAGLIDSDRRR